ncbi:hypothetical protein ACTA71_006989 [Dictyostelium dimigraforme]
MLNYENNIKLQIVWSVMTKQPYPFSSDKNKEQNEKGIISEFRTNETELVKLIILQVYYVKVGMTSIQNLIKILGFIVAYVSEGLSSTITAHRLSIRKQAIEHSGAVGLQLLDKTTLQPCYSSSLPLKVFRFLVLKIQRYLKFNSTNKKQLSIRKLSNDQLESPKL